jgi:hypothetical protein
MRSFCMRIVSSPNVFGIAAAQGLKGYAHALPCLIEHRAACKVLELC